MESSSMCEKNLDRIYGEKLKKTLLKILLINSPFDMEILALKQVEINIKRCMKNQLKNSL